MIKRRDEDLNLETLAGSGFLFRAQKSSFETGALPGYAIAAQRKQGIDAFLRCWSSKKSMLIIAHILASALFALVMYPFIGWQSIWILVGGILIDGDHYLFSIVRFKSFSLKKCYWWHRMHGAKPNYERDILHIAHTIEIFILLAIAGLFLEPILWILQGMILHVLMDFITLFKYNLIDARAISLLGWLKRRSLL